MTKLRLLSLAGATLLTACSNFDLESQLPDNRPDYKQSRSINTLEIPPDLTASSIDDTLVIPELSAVDNAQLSDYQRERNPQTANSSGQLDNTLNNIHHQGDLSWISITDTPDNVFDNVKSFWRSNNLAIARNDKNIGIIETDWLEKRSNLPRGGLMGLLSGVLGGLHDSGIRDKFRTRIDYDGENTLVYMTHYGATEEEVDESGKIIKNPKKNSEDAQYAFVASSRNPELEVEMLRRLNLYLQKAGKQAANATTNNNPTSGKVTATVLSDGTPALIIDGSFSQAWTMLGVAIDRAGYELSGQDRSSGVYSFDKVTTKKVGFIFTDVEKTFESYEVAVADQGSQQFIIVRSRNQTNATAKQSKVVLAKIAKAMGL